MSEKIARLRDKITLFVLTAIFQVTWVSRCLVKQRMMEVVSGDNWSYKECQSTEGKISHSMDLLTPSSPGVFQLCL